MTKPLVCSTAALLLSIAMPAQSFVTSPLAGLGTDGDYRSAWFGGWSDARIQHLDGQHVGRSYRVTQIAFRPDHHNYTAAEGTGRTWTRVTLDLSELTALEKFSTDADKNHEATPTRVFDSSWSWPTLSGLPLLNPASWGGPGGRLRFPFNAPWSYSGRGGIVTDYRFSGGTLANNGTWHAKGLPYFLDTEFTPWFTRLSQQSLGYAAASSKDPCHGRAVLDGAVRGGITVDVAHYLNMSIHAASDQPTIRVLGIAANEQGIDVSAMCNKLFVDLSRPHVVFYDVSTGGRPLPHATVWSPSLARFQLYLQGAFVAASSRRFGLTNAIKLVFPAKVVFSNKEIYLPAGHTTALGPYAGGDGRPYVQYRIL